MSNTLPIRSYAMLTMYAGYLQSAVLLMLRLAWGWEAAQSGWGHLHHVADTADFFRELHIPFPVLNVYISGCTELLGGALLLAGLGTRIVSIPFAFNFIVAIATAGGPKIVAKLHTGLLDGWTQVVDDTAFPFLMLGLVMVAFGPGVVSIDHLIRRVFFKPTDTTPGGFPVGHARQR